MSLIGPHHFCNHKKLIKNKFSKSTYLCIKCNKQFVMLPAKHEPLFPQFPSYTPPHSPPDSPLKPLLPNFRNPNLHLDTHYLNL